MTAWSPGASDPASGWSACAADPASTWGLCDAPILISLIPNSGAAESVVAVTLVGENFVPGATVQVSGAGVVVSDVVVVDGQHITATFTIDVSAAQTARDVTVTVPTV